MLEDMEGAWEVEWVDVVLVNFSWLWILVVINGITSECYFTELLFYIAISLVKPVNIALMLTICSNWVGIFIISFLVTNSVYPIKDRSICFTVLGRGAGLERKTLPPGYVCHRCKVPGKFLDVYWNKEAKSIFLFSILEVWKFLCFLLCTH